ncbi:MAG: hypothetical protein AAFZ99_04495 [Pseudomonadota bacterium]
MSGVFGAASAFAVFHDEPLKATTGLALQIYLGAMDHLYGERVSTELMQRCISQDTSEFSEHDLQTISPDYAVVVFEAVHADLIRLSNPENHREIITARIFTPDDMDVAFQKVERKLSAINRILHTGNGRVSLDTYESENFLDMRSEYDLLDEERPDFQGRELSRLGILTDFSRAMGTFTLACENYDCTIIDYFDFEIDDRDTNIQRLAAAFQQYQYHRFDEAARWVGQVFCQEGDDERPTHTSIPVRIEFELPLN